MKSVRITTVVMIVVLAAVPVNAQWSVWCTNCSEQFTQALERVTNLEKLKEVYTQVSEALKQTEQQIQLVKTTFDQYQNMLKNTMGLPSNIIGQVKGEFSKLMSLTKELDVLRGDASGLSQVFRTVYSGRSTLEGVAKLADAPQQYREMFKKMAEDLDRAQEAAFQASGKQIQDMEEKAAELDSQLDGLLETPEGQMQAIQAGNQIAGMQLQEMQKLRSLLAVVSQADIQKQAQDSKRQQIKDVEDAKELEAFKRIKQEIDGINKTQF